MVSESTASRTARQRGVVDDFVRRHDMLWEGGMALLALVYLAFSYLFDTGDNGDSPLLLCLAAVFLVEFGVRIWDAPSRYRYLRAHWIDLVSCIPLIGGLRALRLLRLLRLGAALRILVVAEHAAHRHGGGRQSFWFLGPLLAVIWLLSASAYWVFEHGVNPGLHNFGDALYWSGITATTIGYGDVTPVTPGGRVVAGLLVFVGIGLVGFASSSLTSRFLKVHDSDSHMATEIAALRTEIAELKAMLAPAGGFQPSAGSADPGTTLRVEETA